MDIGVGLSQRTQQAGASPGPTSLRQSTTGRLSWSCQFVLPIPTKSRHDASGRYAPSPAGAIQIRDSGFEAKPEDSHRVPGVERQEDNPQISQIAQIHDRDNTNRKACLLNTESVKSA